MSSPAEPTPLDHSSIVRLVGVYDADGSVVGELSYWINARLGRTHCALCDITHGSVRAKPGWKACQRELAVPFDTYHRNDQPSAVRAATAGALPAVVAETAGARFVRLLGPDALEACAGSLDAMLEAIGRAAVGSGLTIDGAATAPS